MSVSRFPGQRAAPAPIGGLRCAECGGAPMIFVPGPIAVMPFCGPLCAAGCGIEPWASADLVVRSTWRDRAQLEAGE